MMGFTVLCLLSIIGTCFGAPLPNKYGYIPVTQMSGIPDGVIVLSATSGNSFNDGYPEIIVGHGDVMYGAPVISGEDQQGQCRCPAFGGETVVYGDLAAPFVTKDGRTHCEEGMEGCHQLGHSLNGHLCLTHPMIDRSCLTRYMSGNDGKLYGLYEETHDQVCVCNTYVNNTVEGAMAMRPFVKVDGTKMSSSVVLSFLVHDSMDNEDRPGPISCHSDPTFSSLSRTTDGRFTIVSVRVFTQTYHHMTIRCQALTVGNEFAELGSMYLKIAEDVKCACNNRSMSDLYTVPSYRVDECPHGQCVCQPGWAGDHCEKCVYTEFGFGCEQNTLLIWAVISLLIIVCVLLSTIVGLLVTYKFTKYVLKKFKKE